ncbi:MAG TPA: aspartate aminotransferase family protein [Kiritimatiellia bacterium]|nr:aspartate aminotransferase family protein [Kiritimatiellia bacterium]HMP35655.1 aspartate aminotransferase family protein [Kiritimatiellia bacterium]
MNMTIPSDQVKHDYATYLIPNYAPNLVFTRGEGVRLWDADGKSYLDFLAGIAVLALGHAHPAWVAAVRDQAATLTHVSNLHFHPLQAELARSLVAKFVPGSKAFFCNSGAEANEALIKIARKWGHDHGRFEVISCCNSFHGRTLATLTATGQDKVQKGFEPLPSGFRYAEFNNLDSFRRAITPQTVAVLVEAVQAEGGVLPATREFLQGLRALCDEHGLLLLMDEVQCGIGRTGHWFGFQAYDVVPDAFSLAKGLGGGFPVGAMLARAPLCDVLQPGTHGTTYGGNPLACAAALAVLRTIEQDGLLASVRANGARFGDGLKALAARYPWIKEARGLGLIWGLVLDRPAKPLELLLIEEGLLTVATSVSVIRFVPPLIVSEADVREALAALDRACARFDGQIQQAAAHAAGEGVKT